MTYSEFMKKGKQLEGKGFYRRALEQYNQAFIIAAPPAKGAMSYQQKISNQSSKRCLNKARIKIPGGLL
ncbi:hypothetical protein PPN82_13935 [Proteus mirabilis]|uniref:hypothetical protein n=1 Tax=Proteus mirabilis TaxID=584 RepID=UPI00234BB247|nr:hypothetical protein [Proteus mirabilis]MDC5892208.1 hypothetical protein [Proteus mirabilis]MDC5913346.1 hypothetical protein [Proteus mirabilis]MDC6005294.1 hypothetical protein [Proteus mirabilis]HEK1158480.1 hypothetical protein [Proteus mirabilis]HEK2779454.1 hypothetical protein [Proteus mirabilis]